VRTGAEAVVARLAYIDAKGGVTIDEHVFDAFDLADFVDTLRSIIARVDEARAQVAAGEVRASRGEWCKYCPAFNACPAQVGLVRALVPELAELESMIATLTPAQAGIAWSRLKDLAPLVKRVEDALKAYVRAHPGEVALPDGRVVMEIAQGRDSVNGERALAIAREYGASDDELQACIKRNEWTALRAVKPKKDKTKKTEDAA
jgi:hypothetical protein